MDGGLAWSPARAPAVSWLAFLLGMVCSGAADRCGSPSRPRVGRWALYDVCWRCQFASRYLLAVSLAHVRGGTRGGVDGRQYEMPRGGERRRQREPTEWSIKRQGASRGQVAVDRTFGGDRRCAALSVGGRGPHLCRGLPLTCQWHGLCHGCRGWHAISSAVLAGSAVHGMGDLVRQEENELNGMER